MWPKKVVSWRLGGVLYLSVVFTWHLLEAKSMAREHKGKVIAGGPAVKLMPCYISKFAEVNLESLIPPLEFHNPLATFTTRGCPNRCSYCAVPSTEGEFKELKSWPNKPIVCDNNLLASSRSHFDKVIDRLKCFPYIDFNQGLDARLFMKHHASRIAELKKVKVRFAFDSLKMESKVKDAIEISRESGLKDFGVYVLIGFDDTPEEARYKLDKVREWKIWPNPMRFQPLDSLKINSYVLNGWSDFELKRMMRYYSRLAWLDGVLYEEYQPRLQGFFD